jgi:hypothetical protein
MICSGLSQNTRGVLDMKSSAALRTKLTGTAPNVLRFRFLQKIHQDNTCPPLLFVKNHYTSYICVSLPFLKKESQCHCMRSFDVLEKNKYAFYLCMLSSSFLLPHTKNPNTLDTTEPCPVPVCRIKYKVEENPNHASLFPSSMQ